MPMSMLFAPRPPQTTHCLQVTFLGDAPVSSSDPSHLMDWKEVSRRVLLRRSGEFVSIWPVYSPSVRIGLWCLS